MTEVLGSVPTRSPLKYANWRNEAVVPVQGPGMHVTSGFVETFRFEKV